jgi:hypothetical protein
MNKLEASYALHLEGRKRAGEILFYEYEAVKFKLGDGAWYTPDFIVMDINHEVSFHETKGFMREAANVRLKVAATKYPFKFVLVKRGGPMGFTYEEI